jgi:DNA-binding transcriptional MerR regulator
MTARSYLSIGDVLTLLRQEFPDITISKIRFLESQGLVDPERTPSGYRKFYQHDVDRLRWVLQQQRENFLPLKVIKDRLDDDTSPTETPAAAEHPDPVLVGPHVTAAERPLSVGVPQGDEVALPGIDTPTALPAATSALDGIPDTRAGTLAARGSTERSSAVVTTMASGSGPLAPARAKKPSGTSLAAVGPAGRPPFATVHDDAPEPAHSPPASTPAPAPSPAPASSSRSRARPAKAPGPGSAAGGRGAKGGGRRRGGGGSGGLSAEDLAASSGLSVEVVEELASFGLLAPTMVAGFATFDEADLAITKLAAQLAPFGIEPRHLRLYKNAADREAGFVEQVVLPLLRQRNPDARARAETTAEELVSLGQDLRSSLLQRALGGLLQR